MSDEIVVKADPLNKMEQEELSKWKRSADTTPLSPFIAANLYQLFLLGHSCEDIAKSTGDTKFPLGLILDARVRHRWDERREAYLEHLYAEAGQTVRQRQVEGAIFLGDVLAAAHLEFGPKFRRFVETGNPKDLDEKFKVTSITSYKMVIDALRAITGQDVKKQDAGPLVSITTGSASVEAVAQKGLASGDAHDLLRMLDAADKQVEAKKNGPK